jgi:hypothetical protein
MQQVEIISDYAVFAASDQSGNLNLAEGMREKALNGKLREMCDLVDLFGRNTTYSFRRGAIVDTRRKSGTETAQTLAGHTLLSGNTIRVYDEYRLADRDIADIKDGSETTSQASIRKVFSRAVARPVVINVSPT